MSRINTVPKGLQSFLGNSNFGDNPSEMSPVAAPVVQLNPFLQVDQIRQYQSPTISIANPSILIHSIEVPSNEIWWVMASVLYSDASVTDQLFGAHTAVRKYPGNEDSASNPQVPIAEHHGRARQQDRGYIDVDWLPHPFPVPGKCLIDWKFDYEQSAAANWDFICYLWYWAVKA